MRFKNFQIRGSHYYCGCCNPCPSGLVDDIVVKQKIEPEQMIMFDDVERGIAWRKKLRLYCHKQRQGSLKFRLPSGLDQEDHQVSLFLSG